MARFKAWWLGMGLVGLAAATAGSGFAQSWEGPGTAALAQRLEQRATAFHAQVDGRPTEGLIELGRLVAMGGSQQGGAGVACFSCHGATGAGDGSGVFPRIAGHPAWYTYKQLNDYASEARPNAIMTEVARQLTEREREAVAVYYALVDAPYPPVLSQADPQRLQWGAQLGAVGSERRGIPACVNCHGAQGSGLAPSVPPIAGQYGDYLALQLNLWRQNVRRNDPVNVMRAIAIKMTDEDVEAVARYYERVRPVAPAIARSAAPGMAAPAAGAAPPARR